tara:strand:- start:1252 stop:3036 length:1785 start_codon:yes stop_codon:yes gene_type:complete
MPSPAFTNTSISNAYRGADQVSKILLGYNHVWPLQSVFSFDTYQSGGELNFRVVSDTQYVACVINDATIFLYQSNVADGTDAIQAINLDAQAYNNLYQINSTVSMTDITLSLYQRKQVKITGRGTQLARYGADYNNGNILVEINNEYGDAINYTISVTGKGSITKTCPVGERTLFSFTAMSRGAKTVTINNLTDNLVDTISVTINTSYTPIPTQIINIGDQAVSGAVSETLTTVKVYCLTEEEAVANGLVILDPVNGLPLEPAPYGWTHSRYPQDPAPRLGPFYGMPAWTGVYSNVYWDPTHQWIVSLPVSRDRRSSGIKYVNQTGRWLYGDTKGSYNFQSSFDSMAGMAIENLIFNNEDLEGNIHAVDLKDVNVNSIASVTQRKLQTIRSNFINTSTNKAINSNVKIVNTPNFKSTHGSEVTYRYPGEHIIGMYPEGAKLTPVGTTANNYTFRFKVLNNTGKPATFSITLRVYDLNGNVVSTNDVYYSNVMWDNELRDSSDYYYPETTVFEFTDSFGKLAHTEDKPLFIGVATHNYYWDGKLGSGVPNGTSQIIPFTWENEGFNSRLPSQVAWHQENNNYVKIYNFEIISPTA